MGVVDSDHPPQRGIEIGHKVEGRTIALDESVLCVKRGKKLDERTLFILQALDEDCVLPPRPVMNREDEDLFVIGDFRVKEPFLLVGACVDKTIRRLRGGEGVVVELLVVVRLLVDRPFRRRIVAAVEETITEPGDVGEFCPSASFSLVFLQDLAFQTLLTTDVVPLLFAC